MKIAYIIPSLQAFGPVVVVYNLVKQLITMGHTVEVFYFDVGNNQLEFPCVTTKITMSTVIDFDSFDIIHSHCLRPDMYLAKMRKHIKKAKTITTLHQDTYVSFLYEKRGKFMSLFYTWLWCRIQSKINSVICISDQLKDKYKDKISAPLTTIYNGCSTDYYVYMNKTITTSLSDVKNKYRIIGTYAFLTKRKGLDQIVRVLKSMPEYAFVVIGNGPERSVLETLAIELNVRDRIFFFPHQEAPQNYLQFFDVYVMPSRSEGFGLAMVEAALEHKAIVCSELLAFREIFPNKEASFFELDNNKALECAISNAYINREEYGERAYNRCICNFTSQVMARNYMKHYESLLTNA